MDEKYAEPNGPVKGRVSSLTGVLIPATVYPAFRTRFYTLVRAAMSDPPGIINPIPVIRAANIFPHFGSDDERRFKFANDLVDILIELDLKVYRFGYLRSPVTVATFADEKAFLGICFHGLLWTLKQELERTQIWPVMETDGSPVQDREFAGAVQTLDYLTARLPGVSMAINNENLGELLYATKRSPSGTAADFAAYLRHMAYLLRKGLPLTPFKQRLAEIGTRLDAVVAYDETIDIKPTNGSAIP
jgi:hypothetical protein